MLFTTPPTQFYWTTLGKNILLDEAQKSTVKATITSTREFIAKIDKKIQDLWDELDTLKEQRSAAAESLAVHEAVLSPVRRLAPEILGHIFEHCIPAEPTHVTPLDSRDAPLLLMHICHRWRQVAQGTPRLWTSLVLYGRIPENFFSTIWLQNSRSLPLDISVAHGFSPQLSRLKSWSKFEEPARSEYPGHGWRMDHRFVWIWPKQKSSQRQETARTIAKHLPRTRKLSISCDDKDLKFYFPTEDKTNIPCLQELELHIYPVSRDGSIEPFSWSILTPQLHTLNLNCCAGLLLPALGLTSKLRQLKIGNSLKFDGFMHIVQGCPELEQIDVFMIEETALEEPISSDRITLPNLVHLGLGIMKRDRFSDQDEQPGFSNETIWNQTTRSLERLRTPSLWSLEFRDYHRRGRMILLALLTGSQSIIRKLAFRYTDLESDTLSGAINFFLTEVEHLEFIRCYTCEGFWDSLTPEEGTSADSWFFPKLKRLTLNSRLISDARALLRFIERRAPPMRTEGGQPPCEDYYLRELALLGCRLDPGIMQALQDLEIKKEGLSIRITKDNSDDEIDD